jgi:chromosomal replication initiator protein
LLGRRLTGHSLEALGGMIGGRDHSTVLYSIRQAEERLAKNPALARDVSELTQQVLAKEQEE